MKVAKRSMKKQAQEQQEIEEANPNSKAKAKAKVILLWRKDFGWRRAQLPLPFASFGCYLKRLKIELRSEPRVGIVVQLSLSQQVNLLLKLIVFIRIHDPTCIERFD